MSEETRINIVKIHELPETTTLLDSDLLIKDDTSITHKFSLSTLVQFIKNHTEIFNFFVQKSTIDKANGIAPLNQNRKLPSNNIKFGKSNGDVYEGSEGAAIETTINTHIVDNSKHVPNNGVDNSGKYLKSTSTEGEYEWGELDADEIVKALGYTPGSSGELVTYTLSKEDNKIILTGSNGKVNEVEISKLYDTVGNNTDGTMTQKAITETIKLSINEITSDTEPENQPTGQYWIREYT